jgi:hypothetical protein
MLSRASRRAAGSLPKGYRRRRRLNIAPVGLAGPRRRQGASHVPALSKPANVTGSAAAWRVGKLDSAGETQFIPGTVRPPARGAQHVRAGDTAAGDRTRRQ